MSDEMIMEDAVGAEEVSEVLESSEEGISEESNDDISVDAESTEELQGEIEQAIEDGASEEEVESMIKAFELKVNGKTFTKELDLSDEEAVKRELQLAAAGRQSMQKVKELEKAYDEALSELKSNPAKFMSELGMDFDELSESHLRAKLTEMQKSPEEVEREKIQNELEEARREARELKEEKERMESEKLYSAQKEELQSEITTALSAHQDLPPTQRTYQRIAETMLWAMERGS